MTRRRRPRGRQRSGGLAALLPGLLPGLLVAGCGVVPTPMSAGTVAPTRSAAVPSADADPAPTPTSSTGSPSGLPTSTSPKPTPSSRSTDTPSPSATTGGGATGSHPVIVIDPGHSGRSIRSRTTNGLLDFDYPNRPEITEAFDVSTCLAAGLRADGYRVVLTKASVNASVSLTERARIADRAHADLAISVHDDHSQGPSFEATYSQLGVQDHPMYRGTGSRRTVFDQPSVAQTSARDAAIIAQRRAAAQGRPVRVTENVYTGRPPLEPGNLALVQLLSHVPWVYNEMGARTGDSATTELSVAAETGYAKGLLDGVESAVPRSVRFAPTSAAPLQRCLQQRR